MCVDVIAWNLNTRSSTTRDKNNLAFVIYSLIGRKNSFAYWEERTYFADWEESKSFADWEEGQSFADWEERKSLADWEEGQV